MQIKYVDPIYNFFLQIVTELVILLCYAQKLEHYTNKKEKLKVFWVKIALFGCTALTAIFYVIDEYVPLNSIFFILFLCAHKYLLLTQQDHTKGSHQNRQNRGQSQRNASLLLDDDSALCNTHLHADLWYFRMTRLRGDSSRQRGVLHLQLRLIFPHSQHSLDDDHHKQHA